MTHASPSRSAEKAGEYLEGNGSESGLQVRSVHSQEITNQRACLQVVWLSMLQNPDVELDGKMSIATSAAGGCDVAVRTVWALGEFGRLLRRS